MATNFLSTANPFHLASSSQSSVPSISSHVYNNPIKCNVKRQLTLCKVVNPSVTKRGISISFVTSLVLSLTGKGLFDANAAILEADDDVELLEKVKKDRKKRLEKQGVISSSTKETGYLQDLVYKLSEVGQAIEKKDLTSAGSVLGKGKDTDWVQKANIALNKLSSSPEEQSEVDTFNSSLASLVSSVAQNDVESSKIAFVTSAAAFEKWTSLTGLVAKDMSSCSIDVAPAEQLCYIPCNFCNIVLAVSVPCSSLFDIVTVRCGHCTNLWSVNMAAAFQSLSWQDVQGAGQGMNNNPEYRIRTAGGTSSKYSNDRIAMRTTTAPPATTQERVVNRPPEKRQRVPSAYNQFIKEEIQRIKANNPDISHREAFSTAAKNWAHFPHIHFGLMLETNNQAKMENVSEKRLMSRAALMNK